MKEFEAGMSYYRRCEDLLRNAKGRVELYAKDTGTTEEFTL